jgi:hypothetical protein
MLLGYSWCVALICGVFSADMLRYHFSGAKSAVNAISQTKQYTNEITQKVKQKAPEPNEALKWLRETAQTYASFVPGARGYVDKAFEDLDRIQEKHGSEVDEIVRKTYDELQRVVKEDGASVKGMYEAWAEIERCIRELSSLAGDAAGDVLQNHPQLKEKLGGSFQALQSMGENYGQEAKEQVNKTFDEVRQIFSQGSTAEAVQKTQQLVEQRTQELKQKGDELWQKGWQQAQPYLEKSPKAKQLLEENKDALKQGNLGHLWAQVRNAADTGSTQKLEQFIQHTKQQTNSGGTSSDSITNTLSSLLGSGSGGGSAGSAGDLIAKVQTLVSAVQKHGGEAEGLLKSTVDEIQDVIKRKSQEAEKITAKAQEEKS